jgi:diguanylate cyclase (GGDEF)-like protein/PAS domain S-box-containing protein
MTPATNFLDDLQARARRLPVGARYALAALTAPLAFALRLALLPPESGLPYLTFYPAVVLALFLFGTRPGALAILLSAALAYVHLLPPYLSWVPSPESVVGTFAFLVFSALILVVVRRLDARNQELAAAKSEHERSEQRLQGVLEAQPDIICRFDAAGAITYVNFAFCSLLGLALENVIGSRWQAIAWLRDLPHIESELQRLSPAHPVVTVESRVVVRSGELRWFQFVNRGIFGPDGVLREVQSVGRDIDERRRLERQLAATQERLGEFFEHAPFGYQVLDANGIYVDINQTALDWIGCRKDEVIGRMTPLDFLAAADRQHFRDALRQTRETGHVQALEFDLLCEGGALRRVSASGSVDFDEQGSFLASRSVMHDITEFHSARTALERVAREQGAMLDTELVGILRVQNRVILWANRGARRILGYEPGELDGQSTRCLYPDEASFEAMGRAAYDVIYSNRGFDAELELVRKDGQRVWIKLDGVLLSRTEGISMWILLDIDAAREREEVATHAAHDGALNDLPDRGQLQALLARSLAQARRLHKVVAVCHLDIDGFQSISDRCGHAAGEQVLEEVTRRLQGAIRADDFACRLGRDEFVVLLNGLEGAAEGEAVLERIQQELRLPFAPAAYCDLGVSASIGVTLTTPDDGDPEALLRHADEAMYRAKAMGGDRFLFFRQAALAS